jgi:hypothetical protein
LIFTRSAAPIQQLLDFPGTRIGIDPYLLDRFPLIAWCYETFLSNVTRPVGTERNPNENAIAAFFHWRERLTHILTCRKSGNVTDFAPSQSLESSACSTLQTHVLNLGRDGVNF